MERRGASLRRIHGEEGVPPWDASMERKGCLPGTSTLSGNHVSSVPFDMQESSSALPQFYL
eukprot:366524-Chlamydomonas_euryale.AAC.6